MSFHQPEALILAHAKEPNCHKGEQNAMSPGSKLNPRT